MSTTMHTAAVIIVVDIPCINIVIPIDAHLPQQVLSHAMQDNCQRVTY